MIYQLFSGSLPANFSIDCLCFSFSLKFNCVTVMRIISFKIQKSKKIISKTRTQ